MGPLKITLLKKEGEKRGKKERKKNSATKVSAAEVSSRTAGAKNKVG